MIIRTCYFGPVAMKNIMVSSTWWSKASHLLERRKKAVCVVGSGGCQGLNIPFKGNPNNPFPPVKPSLLYKGSTTTPKSINGYL
jgi:hypothetical protein